MAVLKREYEISVWHEKLNENGNKLEEKMAVIGAHDMTYLGRATNVHFLTKMNGTHLLTFLLPDKYFDSEKGDFVLNEFKDYLLNESKVKLKYKDEWYEFYIKTVKDTKHYKSYMKNYTCTDAYIDELSRNGYGITFDTELYNNVEEIGIFTDEILDGSLWEYSPENNWGDFTEYTEEKLFKIPVSLFGGTISGYKLNFDVNSESTINNVYTKEKRGLLLGDDLAGREGYFWNCYDESKDVVWTQVDNIPNDGYIYVPYSQLDFCYETNKNTPSGNFIPATEAPHYGIINGVSSYFLAPPSINPESLIQFIAIPPGASVEVDEAGLIVNKNYTYVMTVEDWNDAIDSKYWYTKDKEGDHNGDFKKEVTDNNRPTSQRWFYNRCVTYDGYLDSLGGLEVENGKRISISDRTEINISEDIDLYVKVYKETSEVFSSLYIDPDDWKAINGAGLSEHTGYRVCSATRTRLIMPQLARNYFENAVNIKSVNGWEPMHIDNLGALSQKKNTEVSFLYEKDNDTVLVGKIKVHTSNMDKNDNTYYSIVNFGAVGLKKTILKGKTYCFGIKFKQNYGAQEGNNYFKVGKGSMTDNGDYKIYGELITPNPPIISIPLSSSLTLYYLVNSPCEIENPYLVLQFSKDLEVIIEEVWFFEAYTRGLDFFEDGYFKYSGRDYLWRSDEKYELIPESELKERILFETDVMDGDTYAYLEYFILQLVPKGLNYGIDTFKAKEYISEKVESNSHPTSLPLSAADYTDDDYTIVTNCIDLNKCPHYVLGSSATSCDCKHSSDTPDKFCMYQKYGYCPYMFTTEKHCRKIRTLSGSKSNRFNLTQELGKVFEVYPQYYIEHSSNGNVKTDENGKAIKKVFYITEKGQENKIGYRYEKNLTNIDRTIVSDKIVTKLYVLDVDSELSRTGLCSIKTAEDNPSKDSFIIDFSYYIKLGMLDKELTIADLYGNDNTKLGFLKLLGYYNEQYDMLTNKIISMQSESYNDLQSKVEVDITGYETVLLEICKLKKLMSKYTMDPEHPLTTDNKTFESYLDKYDLQESRKKSILKELLGLTETLLTPQDLLEKYKNKEAILGVTQGLYAQFIKEYNTILGWKKERAKYLNDINNLTKEFYSIYEPYLKEGTWSNSNYLTDNAYYHDALDVAAEGAIPKVTYSIKVVPLGILDDTYEVGIADTTYIEDIGMFGINKKTGLPNRLKVIISLLDENLDKPNEDSINVLNFTTLFEDLFQLVTASVLSLTYNENIYKRSSNFTSNLSVKTESLLGTLDGNDLVLLNTSEENIKLDSKGLTGSDINNHNNLYKLDGQGLFFSNNGGQSWKSGVGPDGINADYINTGTLDAGNIRIVDNDYLYFLWDSTGITAYKDPAILDNDLIFGQDFARFNKYGLSLVEKNKIRLRAGYEFNGNNGDINEENDMGQDIGFYLYDKDGLPIFKTETNDNSARLSLAGEIYATSKLVQRQIKDYLYSIEYEFTGDRIYYIIDSEVPTPTGLTSTSGWIKNNSELVQETIYKDNNNNYYYKSEDDLYYSLIPATTKENLTVDYNSEIRSVENYNLDTISYVENDILKNVALYEVNGRYYEHKEVEYETEPLVTNEISGYINNKAAYATNDYIEKEDGIYTKRLITYAKNDDNNNLLNVFSVLADGTLYMGGYIKPSEEDKSLLDNLDDYIRIIGTDSSLLLTTDGNVLIGGKDAFLNLLQQINAVIAGIISMNLITHNHYINNGNIRWTRPILSLEGKQTVFVNRNNQVEMTTKNSEQIRFSSSKTPYIAISPTYPNDNENTEPDHPPRSTITWIKLDDFLNYICGETLYSGQATGSGGEIVPSGGDTSPNATTILQKVLEATTKLVKSHCERGMHYQNPWWNDTTIDGRQIHSRTDCSGLVDGIFQYLGDAPTTYVNTTHTLASNPPNNWKVISLSALDYNPANLLPGDIIVNTAEHTEIVVQINGNNIKCKGFGSDSRLRDSYLYGGYMPGHSLGWYNWVLRKYL